MGNDSVTPLARDARAALDAYLAQSPRLGDRRYGGSDDER